MEVGHLLFLQEQIKGIIIAQSVAKTLWAYGTMRRATGSGLMRELPGLSEALAGTFTAQEVANTLDTVRVFSSSRLWRRNSMG
jgi:hypothetical protein